MKTASLRFRPFTVAVLAVAAFFLPAAHALAGNCCVGYINLQRIISESTDGRAAGAQFYKDVDARQQEVEKLLKAATDLKTYIETHADRMNEEERSAKMAEYEKAVSAYNQALSDVEAELRAKNETIIKAILGKVDPIVRQVADEMGLSIIIREPAVLGYVRPEADITTEVLRRLEAESSKGAAAPGAGGAGPRKAAAPPAKASGAAPGKAATQP